MALVHDLAEAQYAPLLSIQPTLTPPLADSVGDITPVEGVSPEMKHNLEQEAMHSFLHEMLGGEGCREARERISSLWDVRSPGILSRRN